MKTLKLKDLRHTTSGFFLFAVIFLISSCAQQEAFMQSSVVPAAHGKVKVKKDNNQNYKIDVKVTDLAEIEKVYSRNHAYIVWMETYDGDTEKLGQLVSSKGFLSNQLKAEMETVSSIEPAHVFITAERDQNARYPSNNMILRTRNF